MNISWRKQFPCKFHTFLILTLPRDNGLDGSSPCFIIIPSTPEVILIAEEETSMDKDKFPELNSTNVEQLRT